ncbi:hypothetical protein Taro_001063 [Colocasia esculenta]|uniref:Uncharacterized protein n=1 Tax=Colocasia esculenta TaxID=4460 RepID=A0A843T8Y0_COLES|nr:hypothetical protein [Colocasia esculenta]
MIGPEKGRDRAARVKISKNEEEALRTPSPHEILSSLASSPREIACKTMYQNKSKKVKKSTKDKYLSTAPKMPVDSPAQTDLIGYWQDVPIDSPSDACRQICTDRTNRLLARCACR